MNSRNIIFLVFFLVTFALVPVFVIWPSIQNIRQTAQAIYSEYEQLEAKHRRGHEMKNVSAEYRELEPQSHALDTIAIAQGDELAFITSLEKLANETNVEQVLKLSAEKPKKIGDYQRIDFTLALVGSYTNTVHYLAGLESMPAITQIYDLRIDGASTKNDNIVQTHVTASVLQQLP